MSEAETIRTVALHWEPAFRILPSRFPTVHLFERVANPEDFDALYALEALTNDRLRDELGHIALVPPDDRVFGPGSTPIMAAFTHLNPSGSRFSDGSYGVFYAAIDRATAMAETRYHHGRFLAATREPPLHLEMRLYSVRIQSELHDLRAIDDADLYSATDYTRGRRLGRELRLGGSNGVVFRSVRHPPGACVGLFKARGASHCIHAAHLVYVWDGTTIRSILERLSD
jgi:hypothetical protein